MAAAVAQAVIAEWGAGRLGVAWTDPKAPESEASGAAIGKRTGIGAGIGVAAVAAVCALLVSTKGAELAKGSGAGSVIAVSLLSAGMYAMRDELVLHGVVLRIFDATDASRRAAPIARVVACGVASAAAALGEDAPARAVLVQALLGLVCGALWVQWRGAWAAWGAHTAFRFGVDLVLSGGLYEAHVAANDWGGGSAGALGGSAAVVALLPFGAAAVLWAARRGAAPRAADSPPNARVG